jgi:hypothetical protein
MYPVDICSLVFSLFLRNFKVSVQILFSQMIFYKLDIQREPRRVQKGTADCTKGRSWEMGEYGSNFSCSLVLPFSMMVQGTCPSQDLPLLL